MKGIIILLLFIGIVFVIMELVRSQVTCPQERIVYRYIPRTFAEEQAEPVSVTDIFETMFTLPDPWVQSIGQIDNAKQEAVNKYFISQL